MSKKSFYFSHDNNARNDEKILAVRMELGAEGYGIYFMLLEKLLETENYILIKDYNRLAFDLRVSSEKIKKVIENFGLFQFTDDGKLFYSDSLLRRMQPLDNLRKQRSEAGKKSAEKRQRVRENTPSLQEKSTTAERPLQEKSTEKVKESKVKEDSVCIGSPHGDTPQKSFKSLTKDEFYNSLKPFVSQYGKEMVRDFFDYWTEPNGKGTPKFQLEKTWDTARRLSTWEKNEEKFNKSAIGRQPTNNDPPKRKRNEL